MTRQPLVSIVMTAYGHEALIGAAIVGRAFASSRFTTKLIRQANTGMATPYDGAPEFTERWHQEKFEETVVSSRGPHVAGGLFKRTILEAVRKCAAMAYRLGAEQHPVDGRRLRALYRFAQARRFGRQRETDRFIRAVLGLGPKANKSP